MLAGEKGFTKIMDGILILKLLLPLILVTIACAYAELYVPGMDRMKKEHRFIIEGFLDVSTIETKLTNTSTNDNIVKMKRELDILRRKFDIIFHFCLRKSNRTDNEFEPTTPAIYIMKMIIIENYLYKTSYFGNWRFDC